MALNSIEQLVSAFQQRQQSHPRNDFQRVLVCWAEMVGPLVAAKTRPLQLQNNILWVAVPTAIWAQNLSFERHLMLQKLNPQLNHPLRDIRFSTARWSGDRPNATGLELDYQQQVWEQHPSRLPDTPAPLASGLLLSAEQQFRQYTLRRQQQTRQLPLCNTCHGPTPPGELERWGCCALCVRQTWSS